MRCGIVSRIFGSASQLRTGHARHIRGRCGEPACAVPETAKRMSVLVQNSVKRTLFTMAFPMLAGTFAMNAYSLTDAWFVARLGTFPLAAIGFAFPVIMLLSCVSMGLGSGITALTSHALGRRDHEDAAQFATYGMALASGVAAIIAVAGYLSIVPIFTRLGADAQTLPLVGDYMRIWYIGAPTMCLPMIGNGILISMGDSRNASRLMMLGTLLNLLLNPILIFGWLGVPAMGIRGSALATVIAQAVSMFWLLRLLWKHRLLKIRGWRFCDARTAVRRILQFGIPGVLSTALMPISATVITRLLSGFGNEAVAASSVASRIEMFAFIIPMSLGMSMMPFISQNYGAGRLDRIREAVGLSYRFALLYGGGVALVFYVCARPLGALFSSDPNVVGILVDYIRIIAFGYGLMETHRYSGMILTGMHRPMSATILNAIRVVALLIPLSCLGAHFYGVRGVFAGRLATDVLVGILGILWVRRMLRQTTMAVAQGSSCGPVRPEIAQRG